MNKAAQIILAAIIFFVITMVIRSAGAMAAMDIYMDPQYAGVFSPIMMPAEGPPPMEFTLFSGVMAFLMGLFFAVFYNYVKGSFKQTPVKKGLLFGFLVFLVAGVPSLFMFLFVNLPIALTFSWMIESLIVLLIGGITTARIVK